jgi:hypothetical protein
MIRVDPEPDFSRRARHRAGRTRSGTVAARVAFGQQFEQRVRKPSSGDRPTGGPPYRERRLGSTITRNLNNPGLQS